MLANALATVTRGYGRWDIDAVINAVGPLAGMIVTFALLASGGGLPALGAAACVMNGSMLIGYAIAGRTLGGLGIRGARFRRRALKEMMRQGRALQIVNLVGATNMQADRFMLLPFASLSWIGAYSLGSRVVIALRAFPLSAFAPLMVRAAGAELSGGREAVRALYLRTLTVTVRYMVSFLLVLYAAAYAATLAWLGSGYTTSAGIAVVLGIGFALNIATGPGTAIAIGCGRAELDRNYNLVGLGLNLGLTVLLGVALGAWGVVIATTLGLALSSGWLLVTIDRWLERDYGRAVLASGTTIAIIAGMTAIGVVGIVMTRAAAPSGRITNLLIASGMGAAGLALLAGVRWEYVKGVVAPRIMAFARRRARP
jgi:O-antigen/teichoic acid export membrane protein